jgi:hypothetical protein
MIYGTLECEHFKNSCVLMSDIRILHIKTGGILKTPTESCALLPQGGAEVVRKQNRASVLYLTLQFF